MNGPQQNEALNRLRLRLAASNRLFTIAYWVPHADGGVEQASPIQGFGQGVLRSSHLLSHATSMPADFRELFSDRKDIVFGRSIGLVNQVICPVMLEALPQLVSASPYLVNCVLSTADVVGAVQAILSEVQNGWLHIGPPESQAPFDFESFGTTQLIRGVKAAVDSADNEHVHRLYAEFLNATPTKLPLMWTDCPLYGHNATSPNSGIFRALSIQHRETAQIHPDSPGSYEKAVVRSADAVRLLRKALLTPSMVSSARHDLTLAVDSLTWPFLRGGIARIMAGAGLSKNERRVVTSLLSRESYRSQVMLSNEELEKALESPNVRSILDMRSAELKTFTDALTLLATSSITPTIRLSPGLNRLRGSLTQISGCARGNGPHQNFKLQKLVDGFASSMARYVDDIVFSAIRRHSRGMGSLNLVSDLPLEWLKIDGLPLSILHDVSRIPATPGNVMLSQCIKNERVLLGPRDFREILVVRSFEDGDPIAKHLEAAIKASPRREDSENGPNVKFVDVSTVEEFVEAINAFSGAVLVFDGHGSTDDKTGVGSIIVGGEPLDVWELRGKLRVPPIVLLSACDTYPVDGSHGSSAIGLLALGATTVLGTLLPVHSHRAAVFIARLVYRIAKFVPVATAGSRLGVDWRAVMSGMLRMTYASEILSQFEKDFRTPFLEGVRTKTNVDINMLDGRWLIHMVRRLAATANTPARDIWNWLEQGTEMPDSLKYVQLGRPELISIHEVSPDDVAEAFS